MIVVSWYHYYSKKVVFSLHYMKIFLRHQIICTYSVSLSEKPDSRFRGDGISVKVANIPVPFAGWGVWNNPDSIKLGSKI